MPRIIVSFELLWFQQNFEDPLGAVRFNVRVTTKFGTEPLTSGIDMSAPESELQAIAVAAGKTNWDRDDIIEWVKQNKGQTITAARQVRQP